ncbi:hypothetical protein FKG94_23410 [Exilibacterium tricleocarpae]|uniref:Uncharacterized protein n=1 Tax=Exilibacterium tricleocarpae TaxID=2591008 RepID=A0A545STG6_9GAMM|nr:hypothetical protein [Exilibacterium tricleocarpae]TQV68249.1 hypothetical protein FKG94_23410 [Exilibacterium tricleocarpae]
MPRSLWSPALLAVVFVLAVSACDFDGGRQAEIAYPRIVELKNASPDRIDLTAFSSAPDAKATFFLEGVRLSPGAAQNWRIRLDAYEDILTGRFVLDGTCGDTTGWQLAGELLKSHIVEQADQGKVVVTVPACGG